MATNSKPESAIYVDYGALGSDTDPRGLIPVLIAPRYLVYDYTSNEEECKLCDSTGSNLYTGTAFTGSLPTLPVDAKLDAESVSVFCKNPVIQINTNRIAATVAADGNVLTFESNIATLNGSLDEDLNGVDVHTGDRVKVYSEDDEVVTASVVTVDATYGDATISDVSVISGDVEASAICSTSQNAEFTGTVGARYIIEITDSTSDAVVLKIQSVVGDLGYKQTLTATAGATVSVGTLGCQVVMSDTLSADIKGTVLELSADAPQIEKRNLVYIDRTLPAGSYTVEFCTAAFPATQRLANNLAVVGAGVISIAEDIYMTLGNASYKCVEGELFVNFRALRTAEALTPMSSNYANIVEWVGPMDIQNPLGMLYAAASKIEGATFYLVATEADSDDAYIDAINFVGQYEDMYAIQPYSMSADVRSAVQAVIAKYANPLIAHFKYSWLGANTAMQLELAPEETLLATVDATGAEGVVTFIEGDPVALGARKGDTLRVVGGYDSQTAVQAYTDYTITAVSAGEVTISGTIGDAADAGLSQVKIIRNATKTEFAKEVAAEAAKINSRRHSLVWGDDLCMDSFGVVPLSVIAARLAAWRNALPPHAPMSTLVVPGVYSLNTNKFTDTEYAVMNAGGVWIIKPELDGTATNYHQITTRTDGTLAEENSCVSAGDYIIRTLRKALKPYRSGQSNATGSLLTDVSSVLKNQATYLMGLEYEAKYGPLMLGYTIRELKFADSNKAALICKAHFDIPEPTSSDTYYFTLF